MDTGTRDALAGLAAQWGVPLLEAQRSALERFGELLLEWNARINLTGARTSDTLVADHLPDAFAVASLLPDAARLVDVGSGGGLPALPLAVLRPALQVTLVEPLGKKVAFLRTAVRELGLSGRVTVEARRAEDLADEAFDVAMSRATFAPDAWVRVARRLVRAGGQVLVLTVPATHLPGRRVIYFGGRRALIQLTAEECST